MAELNILVYKYKTKVYQMGALQVATGKGVVLPCCREGRAGQHTAAVGLKEGCERL